MFQKITHSWQLVKASAAVLNADRELIVFPLVSFIGLVLVTATFFVPVQVFSLEALGFSQGESFFAFLFVYYVVQYFVIFYANSALVGAALIRMRGGNPSVGDGFRIASQHFTQILGYAVLSATVGVVLKAISERVGILGRLIVSFVGLSWNVATYLAVPVLVSENMGPIDTVKRSSQLLKKTWGEQISGNFGIGIVFSLIGLLAFLSGGALALWAMSYEAIWLAFGIIGLTVLALAVTALLSATLSGIYSAAVYRYAADGIAPEQFDQKFVEQAFYKK